jgi:hypothetical protein
MRSPRRAPRFPTFQLWISYIIQSWKVKKRVAELVSVSSVIGQDVHLPPGVDVVFQNVLIFGN